MMTLEEAKRSGRCRICGRAIVLGPQPVGWTDRFGEMVWPIEVVLDFGAEFAHRACLDGLPEDPPRVPPQEEIEP